MWKKTFCWLIVVVFSNGCILSSTMAPTQQAMPQETSHIIPANPKPTATPISEKSSFTKINLAHQNKQTFSEYIDFQLLVKTSEYGMGVLNLSNMEIQNEQTFPDSGISYPAISGDGVLFAQIVFQNGQKFLQVKSFLTDNESSLALPSEASLPIWLNDKKLAIWGGSSHLECLNLLLTYDSSTAEITYPAYSMPELQMAECIQLPLLTRDGTRMIYPWKMFDFRTGTSRDVFPFMRNLPQKSSAHSMKEIDENISVVHVKENTLSYLLNVPLGEISKADLTPEKTLLPGLGTKEYWWQPLTWISNEMQIGMDLIDPDTDLEKLTALDQQVPTKFYLIDFAAHKIFDYDLDRAVFVESSPPQSIRNGFPSPDGKYFAWTIYESGTGRPVGSKVLELSSGSILSIPKIELLGWIISKAE